MPCSQHTRGYSIGELPIGELPIVKIGIEHNIRPKGDSGTVAFQPRRLSKRAEEEVQKELKELERMGVVPYTPYGRHRALGQPLLYVLDGNMAH